MLSHPKEWYGALAKDIFNPNYAAWNGACFMLVTSRGLMGGMGWDSGTLRASRWQGWL